jgi:hypothetical protein
MVVMRRRRRKRTKAGEGAVAGKRKMALLHLTVTCLLLTLSAFPSGVAL